MSSGMLFAKQKLEVILISDKQEVMDFTKLKKITMCRVSEANSKNSHKFCVTWWHFQSTS